MYIDIETLMEGVSYPADCEEVIETCGGRTVELQQGEETVAEALGRCNAGEIQTAQSARETLLASLSEGAIGRKYYSDRDPPVPGTEWREPLSL
ncbi:DUF2795 domain-containing protein [Halorhabdus sp. CUG00001]|uniref:DUF5789 family protein n=1 Tax=Halorhabdus sp. CUG00001 TaxID=2600297 RepID=UPI00131D6406|nr:DUF2795 domain-containing protein [Halorhabdus sp. CUG00001]